jgi:AcrR family transcriptional regulator
MAKRTVTPPADARQRIMSVSVKLFAQKGFEGVSVRDISAAAKVNVSLISYYFGGKEGLYVAILEEHAKIVGEALTGSIRPFRDAPIDQKAFLQGISSIIRLMVENRLENPEIAQIMHRERLNHLPYARHIYEDIMSPLSEMLFNFLDEAQKQGVVRKDLNLRASFICMLESIWGFMNFHDCKVKIFKDAYRFPKDKEEFVVFLTRLYTEGVFA